MTITSIHRKQLSAFSIVELMVVISVIAIMAGLAISAFSNASQDTRRVTARQQQVAVQNAVNAWVNAESTGIGKGVTSARGAYNAASTSLGRLNLIKRYLDDTTFDHFAKYTTNTNQVSSSSLSKTNQHLTLATWSGNSYPKVELNDTP